MLTITLSSQSELSVSPPSNPELDKMDGWMEGRKAGRKAGRMNGWMDVT